MRFLCRFLRVLIIVFVVGSGIQITAMVVAPHAAPAMADTKCQTMFDSWKCFLKGNSLRSPSSLFPACKTPPTPQMPGSGFSGSIDGGPPNPNLKATTLDQPLDVYGSVEYPPPWSVYDVGCTGSVSDPGAMIDTTIGNWIKGVATSLIAIANSLHRLVSPPTFMNHLDVLVSDGSHALRDALFVPYIGLSLLLIGIWILILSRRKNLSRTLDMVVWALLVMFIAVALWDYPVKAGHAVDSASTAIIGNINANILGNPTNGDPSSARASLLTENVLYKPWLQGELGSADSLTANQFGPRLLGDQTYTYGEAATITKDPSKASQITVDKQHLFIMHAAEIHNVNQDAYNHLKGDAGGRIGAGFMSLIAALFTVPFMILADVLIVVALFIIRMIVIFFPAIAVIGVFLPMRRFVLTVFERGLAAVVNAIVFATGAAINTLAVGILLNGSIGLPRWVGIFLSGVVTLLLWQLLKPFRRLNSMVSARSVAHNASLDVQKSHRIRRFTEHRARHRELSTLQKINETLQGLGPQPATAAGPTNVFVTMPESYSRPEQPPAPEQPHVVWEANVARDPEQPEQPASIASAPTALPPPPKIAEDEDVAPQQEEPAHGDVEVLPRFSEPLTEPQAEPIEPAAQQPTYIEPIRGDQVASGEGMVWRIWNPATNTYEVITNDNEEPEQESA